MSSALALLLLPAGLAGITADQFQVLVEQLRQELAPVGVMEAILVEQVVAYLARLRKSAQAEPEETVKDAAWLRYHSMAERGFWRAYNELKKSRRDRARAANATATAGVAAPSAAPAPSPAPAAPPAQAIIPPALALAPAPAPALAPAPAAAARPALAAADPAPGREPHRRTNRTATTEADRQRWQAECLALIAAQEAAAGIAPSVPVAAAPEAELVAAGR